MSPGELLSPHTGPGGPLGGVTHLTECAPGARLAGGYGPICGRTAPHCTWEPSLGPALPLGLDSLPAHRLVLSFAPGSCRLGLYICLNIRVSRSLACVVQYTDVTRVSLLLPTLPCGHLPSIFSSPGAGSLRIFLHPLPGTCFFHFHPHFSRSSGPRPAPIPALGPV